ncbi:hypothetical protein UFOVP1244_71 [uncultured Caudovirales phage]|uniref:Uncharacterized protein n=1 Tax=uncultured Caudovirales phage TaxID=2100421 RepID=A0A6J5REA9_9CAUD|nr:hypothetical protein UFOVP1244_71 [uncultured Caudovirales phage]
MRAALVIASSISLYSFVASADCTVSATPDEMHFVCGYLKQNNIPLPDDCIGWDNPMTVGVLPTGEGCVPPPPDQKPPAAAFGFYFTSYGKNDMANGANGARLDAYHAQIPTATHAVAAVHVRVPGGPTSNAVARDGISEDPGHLGPWFAAARQRGLKTGLIVILFSDDGWGWGGDWKPSSPSAALASYYQAAQPYVQAAQSAGAEFVILCDEWSNLYINKNAVPAFQTLFSAARRDFSGRLTLNINKMEETAILPEIVALTDVVGITAYVPLSRAPNPSTAEMVATLNAPRDGAPQGYTALLADMAEKWGKQLLLTTGYKSTNGAAIDPADQPDAGVDYGIQARAWQAFIEATRGGVGDRLYGILGWRLWPSVEDDDGATGFSVINKPAAKVISDEWKS